MDSQIDMTCINETAKSIICRVLNCSAADIKNMQELSGGNTNSSFVFEVFGVRYEPSRTSMAPAFDME